MAQANSVDQSVHGYKQGDSTIPESPKRTRGESATHRTHKGPDGVVDPVVSQESDEEMVMTSVRLTPTQVRSLDIVSQLTGRKKAEIIREALDAEFERLSSPEEAEAMAEVHRKRVLKQTEQLREMLGSLAGTGR